MMNASHTKFIDMKTLVDLHIPRENSSLRQQATDRLREAVLSGMFEPGRKLVERDLCEMLGISRSVLREALQHLGAEGLIKHVPHKGPMVATISAQEARDIYAVRGSLEALAGAGFALHATDEQVSALREVLNRLEKIDAGESRHTLLDVKNEFYSILMEGCGNSVVGGMLTLLNNRVTMLRRTSLSAPGRLTETLKELDEIVTAIEQRDSRLAGELCAAHVATAAAVAMKALDSA